MLSAEKLETLERGLEALGKIYPEPPTYEEFVETWPSWDTVSKRIIRTGAEDPGDDVHLIAIREYLRRMGEL